MTAITRFFVDRWQFTLVLFALLVALGLSAIQSIPKSEDPISRFPIAVVTVALPGADAEQMERLIVIPIENAINRIEDVSEVTASAAAGVATIQAEFTWGVDPERKFDEFVRELNVVRPSLPDGIVEFRLTRANTANANVTQMALVGPDASPRQLEALARQLRDSVERAPGVQEAEIWGAQPSEVRVALDLDKLSAYRLPPGAVLEAIQREGNDIPLGAVESGGRRFNLQASGSFSNLEEIRATALRAGDGQVLTVGDVATVDWANDEVRHITRFNGENAVFVTVRGKLGANVFDVVEGVHRRAEAFKAQLPQGVRLDLGFDQSETVAERLSKLGRDFLIAIVLVLFTLLPLGPRAALVVMVSIPLSLAMGVVAIQWLGYSLNQLSITGFVIALGLLVDDSIVVTENIARRLREGLSPRDAAIAGVQEINIAVIGCTATLLLAFLPLLFLPEGSGEFIRSLPVAVTCTIVASLIVSLTVIPFLASRLLPRSASGHSNPVLDATMGAIHAVYRPVLHLALARPFATVIIGLVAFAASLALIPRLGFSLFPENDSPYFLVEVTLPQGSSLEETERAVMFVDKTLGETPEIGWRFANVGRSNPQIYYNIFPNETLSNIGAVYARFDKYDPDVAGPVLARLRQTFSAYPAAQIVVRRFENGPPVEAPIAVRIQGADIAALTALAAEVETIVRGTPGTRDVNNPLAARLIDLNVGIDEAKAGVLGVPAGAVEQTLRIAVAGAPAASYRDPAGDAYPITLRVARDGPMPVEQLGSLYVWTGAGAAIPLGELAKPQFESGPARIDRFQRERTVTITAFPADGFLASAVTEDVTQRLGAITAPNGYSLSLGGQAEAAAESFAGLGAAILVASFGIMAVLLLEFRTFAVTAVVAFVIPFGIMGGLIALFIAGESLSFTAIIGFIALIGIEIKNSILLVEFATQERARGTPLRQAVETAGEVRFLPVLLTSATAIGGLIPLVLERSPLYSPLAIVIIGGLISSTLVARIVTPAMYLILAPKDGDEHLSNPAHAAS